MTVSQNSRFRAARIIVGAAALTVMPATVVVSRSAAGILAVTGLAALIVLVRSGDAKPWRLRWDPIRGPVIGTGATFLIWCALSASWSPQPGRSLFMTAVVSVIWLGAWSLLRLIDERFRSGIMPNDVRIDRLLLAGLLLGIVLALANWASGGALYDFANGTTPEMRRYRPIYDRFGVVAALGGWPVVLAAMPRLSRGRLRLLAAVTLATIVAAANESTTVALCGGIVTAALTLRWPRHAQALVVAGTIGLVLLAPVVASQVHETAQLKNPDVSSSVGHRLEIWHFAYSKVIEHPLIGWGMDGSRMVPGGTDEIRPNVARLPLHPHDAAMQWWLELGAVGAVLGLAFLLTVLRVIGTLARPVERAFALGSYVTGFGIASLSFGIWQAWWQSALWLTGCLMLAAIRERQAAADRWP